MGRSPDRGPRGAVAGEPPAPSGDISDLNLARPEDKVDAPSIPPPSGAVVLFEGTRESLDQWTKIDGKSPASWELVGGGARQVKGGNIITRQKFDGRFKLHVEFRIPCMPGRTDKAGDTAASTSKAATKSRSSTATA